MENKVLIIGSGLTGRGMLGELFYQENYDITFADIKKELVDGLKKQGFYHVKQTHLETNESKITKVDRFKIIDTRNEKEQYVDEICNNNLICTALKADGFDEAIDDIVLGIKERKKRGIEDKLFITLGANYVMMEDYYHNGIEKQLNEEEKEWYKKHVYLVMSVVNRKNLEPVNDEEKLDKYTIVGDDKSVLRVEDIEELRKYEGSPKFFRYEKNINKAMAIKIWSGNVVQCSMAFVALGSNPDMRTSFEAAYDKLASRVAYNAAKEAYYGVHKEFDVEADEEEKAIGAVCTFRNDKFSDDLYRIARQPIRKMGYNDRFIGPARMCIKYGKLPYYICKAMAYGFLLNIPNDKDCVELQETVKEIGIREAIKKYTNLSEDIKDEKIIIDCIVANYNDITEKSFE